MNNDEVSFHIKHKFTLHGFSMYELLVDEETFQYNDHFKKGVKGIHVEDLKSSERWKHPLVIDMKEKIEETYGMRVQGAFLTLYKDGNDHSSFHQEEYKGNGIFVVSIGGSRMFCVKDSTSRMKTYKLEDGDVFYFNNEFNNKNETAIPKIRNFDKPTIIVMLFV